MLRALYHRRVGANVERAEGNLADCERDEGYSASPVCPRTEVRLKIAAPGPAEGRRELE